MMMIVNRSSSQRRLAKSKMVLLVTMARRGRRSIIGATNFTAVISTVEGAFDTFVKEFPNCTEFYRNYQEKKHKNNLS
uniref:Uncharacterized protein n=1 Tax=Romanomermis culicivorax TaxID=13658 RepID=A0A915HGF5_ROMCU